MRIAPHSYSFSIQIAPASEAEKGRIEDKPIEIIFPQISFFSKKPNPTRKMICFKDENTLTREIKAFLALFEGKKFKLTPSKSYYLGTLPDYTASCLATILSAFDGAQISIEPKTNPFTKDQEKILNDILKNATLKELPEPSYARITTIFGFSTFGIGMLTGFSLLWTSLLAMIPTFLFAKSSRKYAEKSEVYYNTHEKISALPSKEKEALRIGVNAQSSYVSYFKSFAQYSAYRYYGAFLNGYN